MYHSDSLPALYRTNNPSSLTLRMNLYVRTHLHSLMNMPVCQEPLGHSAGQIQSTKEEQIFDTWCNSDSAQSVTLCWRTLPDAVTMVTTEVSQHSLPMGRCVLMSTHTRTWRRFGQKSGARYDERLSMRPPPPREKKLYSQTSGPSEIWLCVVTDHPNHDPLAENTDSRLDEKQIVATQALQPKRQILDTANKIKTKQNKTKNTLKSRLIQAMTFFALIRFFFPAMKSVRVHQISLSHTLAATSNTFHKQHFLLCFTFCPQPRGLTWCNWISMNE